MSAGLQREPDPTRTLYERWAPCYPPVAHNPLMRAEEAAMARLWPNLCGKRVLDLACGSGRYARRLSHEGAELVVAADFSVAMLKQVELTATVRVCADMMCLPFAEQSFDAIICGLAVGHAESLQDWMSGMHRILRAGGQLLYSDFHPQAAEAGMTRSFKDTRGISCTLPHHIHELHAHRRAAARTGFRLERIEEVRIGRELREAFPGSESFYRQWQGLPIVQVIRACK
ncbi:MAG: class I SAM-dependent methyltransferase [Sinobacteraceae bacterium]|nr:class I SAM-dependent methyltransferase [Nevskiaceae bacterium]